MDERIVPGTPGWDRGYPDHIQRYEFVADRLPPGAAVLDAGCGTGYGAAYLADRGAARVVAVDISGEALELARRHFDRDRVCWVREDCQSLRAVARRGPFDLVCSLENLEHLEQPERFLARAASVLKENGFLIVSTPNRPAANRSRGVGPNDPPTNPFHTREYDQGELETILGRYFARVVIWHQIRTQRYEAISALEPLLFAIWSNPALRIGRLVQTAIRRRAVPSDFQRLLPPPEWEIVPTEDPARETQTFLAVCSQRIPIRPTETG